MYITDYYKNLFGKEPVPTVKINSETWRFSGGVSPEDCVELVRPFEMKEVEWQLII
jgi:hypothetical protein